MFGLSTDNVAAALLAVPMELQRITSELRAGLTEYHNGQRITGDRYIPAGGRAMAWGGAGRLTGWSVQAVGGPVKVLLRDGRTADGEVLAVIDLVEEESDTQSLSRGGVAFPEGLYLDRSGAGTLLGAVWIGAVD